MPTSHGYGVSCLSDDRLDSWVDATLDDVLVDAQPGFAQRSGATGGRVVGHLRPNNISPGGWLVLNDIKQVTADAEALARCALVPGDILFNSTNSLVQVGKSALVDHPIPAVFSNHVTRLRIDVSVVTPEYVAAWLRHLYLAGHFRRVARQWINQAAVSTDSLRRLPLRYPADQLEREQIAGSAVALRNAIRAAQARPGMARRATARWFEYRLAAEPEPAVPPSLLGEIADVTGGLALGPARAAGDGTLVRYLRVANVARGEIDLTDVLMMRVTRRELDAKSLMAGDLLMVEGHGNTGEVGRVARWDGSPEPHVHQNHLFKLRPRDPEWSAYLLLLLNSRIAQEAIKRKVRVAAGINTLRISDVRQLEIPVPSQRLLMQVADAVSASESLERRLVDGIARLRELERSALAYALGGSAVAGEPTAPEPAGEVPMAAAGLTTLWSAMSAVQQRVWREAHALERPFRAAELPIGTEQQAMPWLVDSTLELLAIVGVVEFADDDVGRLWQVADAGGA